MGFQTFLKNQLISLGSLVNLGRTAPLTDNPKPSTGAASQLAFSDANDEEFGNDDFDNDIDDDFDGTGCLGVTAQ